jgi:hypothetical protein
VHVAAPLDVFAKVSGLDASLQVVGRPASFLAAGPLTPSAALLLYAQLRSTVTPLGWSVLIVDAEEYGGLLTTGLVTAGVTSKTLATDAEHIFRTLEEELVEDARESDSEDPLEAYRAQLSQVELPLPKAAVTSEPYHFLENIEACRVLVLPVPEALAIAAVGFGGFNAAPGSEVNAVLHSYWYERFGAVPVYAGPDYIEFSVARPPASPEALRTLVRQHYIYCPDILEQGGHTLPGLARAHAGERWFFWWD